MYNWVGPGVLLLLLQLAPDGGSAVSIDGCWWGVRITASNGGGLLVTNGVWGAALGYLDPDGLTVAFSLGLANLVAMYDPARDVLRFSNGATWTRDEKDCFPGTPPPVPSTITGSVPRVAGCWKTSKYSTTAIIQTGHHVSIRSAPWSWSPALGEVDNSGRITFRYGLPGLTAQVTGTTLTFSNGISWGKLSDAVGRGCGDLVEPTGLPTPGGVAMIDVGNESTKDPTLDGCWESGDPGEPPWAWSRITSLGSGVLYLTNARHAWSPAVGHMVDRVNLVFSLGLTNVQAQYNASEDVLHFTNGLSWRRVTCEASPDRPEAPYVANKGVPEVGGCWEESRAPSRTIAVLQQGGTVVFVSQGYPWSPAVGQVSFTGRVLFRYGLSYLTLQLSDDGLKLYSTDGTTWRKVYTSLWGSSCGVPGDLQAP